MAEISVSTSKNNYSISCTLVGTNTMLTALNSFIQKLSIILGMNGTKGGSSTTKVFFYVQGD
jgi:hypothetical protein